MPISTSPQPWHIKASTETTGAVLKDATGKAIATFTDYRDAELVLSYPVQLAEELDEVAELRIKVEDLENRVEQLGKTAER